MISLGCGITIGSVTMSLAFSFDGMPTEVLVLLVAAVVVTSIGCAGVIASAHRARSLPLVAIGCLTLALWPVPYRP